MTYWEFSAAVSLLATDDEEAVEPPDYETFLRAREAIMANPHMVN